MKKIITAMTLTLLLVMGVMSTPTRLLAGELKTGIKFDPSLAADTVYSFREMELGAGAGLNLATFGQGIFQIRAEWVVFSDSEKNKVGAGIGINIPNALRAAGADWIPAEINPEIGALGLLDLNSTPVEGDIGIYITILKIGL